MKTDKIETLKTFTKQCLGLPLGRNIPVFDDDLFIVSYPKSGNTWVRFILANLLNPDQEVNFSSIRAIIPGIYKAKRRQMNALERPRVIKSHEYLDPRYRKVLYVVRDPRDVLVSYYHYEILRGEIQETLPIEDFASQFLSGNVDSFGSWSDHVGGWIGAREGSSDFVLIRYEDLKADPLREVKRMTSLLGSDFSTSQLEDAIAKSSFDNMRRLDHATNQMTIQSESNRSFVRKGKSGSWRDELTPATIKMVEESFCSIMKRLSYLN